MAEFTKTYTFNCPYCGNAKIVKNGKQAGKQRYRCKSCGKQFNDTGAVGGRRATLGSYVSAIKRVFPDAEHIQSEGIRARVNNNLSERLQGAIRDREKTLRALDGLETGQRYFDGWAINYNLFREHEGIKGQTPAEIAGVNPPFTEWADVVRVAAMAERTPAAPEPIPDDPPAPDTTHFVPDAEARRRPEGETDEEPWPPSPAQIAEWRNAKPTAKERVAASAPKVRVVGPTRQTTSKRKQSALQRGKPPRRKSPKATAGRMAKAR